MVLISSLVWAYILARVFDLVAEISKDGRSFRTKMIALNSVIGEKKFPHDLTARLRYFFVLKGSRTFFRLMGI